MAQPPGMAGQLQLHHLDDRRFRFRCVRCQRDKTASVVATMDGDWTQTLCSTCHDSLVHAQRDEAKKATKTKRKPVQAKRRQPGKVESTPPEIKPPMPISRWERRELERKRPGAGRLPAFFGTAGVNAELVRGGCLWIDGSRTEPLAWVLQSPGIRSWDDVIDEMALKYASEKFIKAVAENARFGEGLRAFLRPSERGFVITRGGVRLAIIRASRVLIPHRAAIHANFLTPGPHWQKVADALHGAEAELVARWKREHDAKAAAAAAAGVTRGGAGGPRCIDRLPSGLPPEVIEACLDASRRVRLERQVAYERPVVLECDAGELTLLPIAGTKARLLVPFRLNTGTKTLEGELILGDRDPLPLLIGGNVADEDAITAWTCALLGFADATCIEFEAHETPTRYKPAGPRRRPPSSEPQRGPSIRTLPRRRPWPEHLEPVGHWIRYSGAFVAGHRRRLNDGQTASAEACDRARQVGISLHPHETWVRPHTRGVPDGIEMRFLWHAPTGVLNPHAHSARTEPRMSSA